jgi:hypothetical protein
VTIWIPRSVGPANFASICGEEPNYVGNGGSEEVRIGGKMGGGAKSLNKLGIDI